MSIENKIILSELKDHLIKNYGDSVKDAGCPYNLK